MKLTSKLIIVSFIIASASLVLGFGLFYSVITTALKDQTNAKQLELTQQMMNKTDRLMHERTIDIRALAHQDQVKRYLTQGPPTAASKAYITKNLAEFKRFASDWETLGIMDTKGTVLASTNEITLGPRILTDYTQLGGVYRKALDGEVAYSDVFPTKFTHDPVMLFMAPVWENGKVIGVVGGNINWSSVSEIIHSVKGSTAYLLSQSGLVLSTNAANEDQLTLAKNYAGSAAYKAALGSATGSAVLPLLSDPEKQAVSSHVSETGYGGFGGNGWILIMDTPTATAFAPALRMTSIIFAILTVAVIIGVAVTLTYLNRTIARPIRRLSQAVNRVALGDLTQTVAVESKDELGTLGRNFNEMTFQLADTHRGLEAATRSAKEGRVQLESSINSLRQGFILTDASGVPAILNEAARSMFKLSGNSAGLSDIAGLLPSEVKLADEVHKTIFKHKPAKFPYLPVRNRFLSLYLTPVLADDTPIGCVLLFDDVTEERILQRSRDEFFSIASHELRTPLTAIRGNAALIEQYYGDVLKDPSLHEMVGDIHASSTRLIEIVNDFLDASRLEQGKMKFEPADFSIESVIEKVIYELGSVSRDKKLYLKFEHNPKSLPLVYADQNRVKQVVYNLIGNAMKFTDHGGIKIRAEVGTKLLKVSVEDTGRGIDPEGQQLLFHKFQQTGSSLITRDTTRGTGLGLYISKLLVEKMGGKVKLESSVIGKGSVFSFSVPLAKQTKKD